MSEAGHNSIPDRGLFFGHISKLQAAMADKEDADAEVKRVKGVAKADGINVEDLKFVMKAIQAEDPQSVVDRLRRQLKYAEWLNLVPQGQGDLFMDRRPADEASYHEGLADGLKGVSLDLGRGDHYARGWQEGQAELAKGFSAIGSGAMEEGSDEDPFPGDDDESDE